MLREVFGIGSVVVGMVRDEIEITRIGLGWARADSNHRLPACKATPGASLDGARHPQTRKGKRKTEHAALLRRPLNALWCVPGVREMFGGRR